MVRLQFRPLLVPILQAAAIRTERSIIKSARFPPVFVHRTSLLLPNRSSGMASLHKFSVAELVTPEQMDDPTIESVINAFRADWAAMNAGAPLSDKSLSAPRRDAKDADKAALAKVIASRLYPTTTFFPASPSSELWRTSNSSASTSSSPASQEWDPTYVSPAAVIKYDNDMRTLRRHVRYQRQVEQQVKAAQDHRDGKKNSVLIAIAKQGPWDDAPGADPVPMPPALPMPVEIASLDTLDPFFDYLDHGLGFHDAADAHASLVAPPSLSSQDSASGSDVDTDDTEPSTPPAAAAAAAAPAADTVDRKQPAHSGIQAEPYYATPMIEFPKGVLYADGRMDLCKKALGPPNIGPLMRALGRNAFVRHFLLGNNVVGPDGARAMAGYVRAHPDQMETWYLAGNCIDAASFGELAAALEHSSALRALWLKRNPLRAESGAILARLLMASPSPSSSSSHQHVKGESGATTTGNLATLDVDQTELGDAGVVAMITPLVTHASPIALRHLYLNGNGIGAAGCAAIGDFLGTPHCALESLFLSLNPLGDAGAAALAPGLAANRSLKRLMLASCGLSPAGAIAVLGALKAHPTLQALSLGQAYATTDIRQRYNWLDDTVVPACAAFLRPGDSPPDLRMLRLGHTAMSESGLRELRAAAAQSAALCFYDAHSIWVHAPAVAAAAKDKVVDNANTRKTGVDSNDKKDDHDDVGKDKLEAHLAANVARLYDGMDYQTFVGGELRFVQNTREVRVIDSVYRNRDAQLARRRGSGFVLDKWWKDGELADGGVPMCVLKRSAAAAQS